MSENSEKTASEMMLVYPGDMLETLATATARAEAAEQDAARLAGELHELEQNAAKDMHKLMVQSAGHRKDAERLRERVTELQGALGEAARLLSVCDFDELADLYGLELIDAALTAHDAVTEAGDGEGDE